MLSGVRPSQWGGIQSASLDHRAKEARNPGEDTMQAHLKEKPKATIFEVVVTMRNVYRIEALNAEGARMCAATDYIWGEDAEIDVAVSEATE